MKNIKNIHLSPDAVGTLCTVFFDDHSKLSVTLPEQLGRRGRTGEEVLRSIECQLGLIVGSISAPEFVAAFENVQTPPIPQELADEAYRCGLNQYRRGDTHCPYNEGTQQHAHFMAGWNSAPARE